MEKRIDENITFLGIVEDILYYWNIEEPIIKEIKVNNDLIKSLFSKEDEPLRFNSFFEMDCHMRRMSLNEGIIEIIKRNQYLNG